MSRFFSENYITVSPCNRVAAAPSQFIDLTGQFADVFPFHQIEISVIIENDLCFAVLENCVHSSVSGSKSVLNPCVGGDKLAIAVVETRFKSGHLNSPH